ncbi:MAG: MarR family transcriptional regulator [Clostridia bacterium]|nr:MarR family transcriptional regulator [Clostridia bacterium]
MLDLITRCYARFRLITYRSMFRLLRERDSSLSAAEAFAVDVIYLLQEPTIKEFADCLGISQPNATYKVNHLIQKGYVQKTPSQEDRREAHLHVTDKYMRYWNESNGSLTRALTVLQDRFSADEVATFTRMLQELTEILPEVDRNDTL